jgi:hypothetical protein
MLTSIHAVSPVSGFQADSAARAAPFQKRIPKAASQRPILNFECCRIVPPAPTRKLNSAPPSQNLTFLGQFTQIFDQVMSQCGQAACKYLTNYECFKLSSV